MGTNWYFDLNRKQKPGIRTIALAVLTFFSLILGQHCSITVVGQDDVEIARELLTKRNYPWYDASTDSLRRFEFPARPSAKSSDRADVPQQISKPNRPNRTAGSSGGIGLSFFAWSALAFLIAGLAGLLVWAFFRLESRKQQTDGSSSQRSMAESIQNLPFLVEDSGGDFRQLAEAAYRRGDFRRAIIFLYSHVLISLDQRGLIRLRKGKTNRQYLRELSPYRPLANFFQQVMVPFEAVFFGEHELSPPDFEHCWNNLEQFQDKMNQTAPTQNSPVTR